MYKKTTKMYKKRTTIWQRFAARWISRLLRLQSPCKADSIANAPLNLCGGERSRLSRLGGDKTAGARGSGKVALISDSRGTGDTGPSCSKHD